MSDHNGKVVGTGEGNVSTVHTDPAAITDLMDAARQQRREVAADGSVAGYRARRTLRLAVELRRQLRRRRTQLVYGFLVILPFLLVLAFEFGRGSNNRRTGDFIALATSSAPNFVVFSLFVTGTFLLPMTVALFFGDTIASEASWSSLKYLLAIPVPRHRLLRQKALASGALSLAALVLLPAVAFLVGLLRYGAGEAVTPTGDAVDFPTSTAAIGMSVLYLAVNLIWVAGLAMLLSVLIDAPLGAVGGTVLVSILSQILDQITALGSLRQYLPTHFAFAWSDLIATDIDWTNLAKGTLSALIYGAVFGTLAVRRFSTKDITS